MAIVIGCRWRRSLKPGRTSQTARGFHSSGLTVVPTHLHIVSVDLSHLLVEKPAIGRRHGLSDQGATKEKTVGQQVDQPNFEDQVHEDVERRGDDERKETRETTQSAFSTSVADRRSKTLVQAVEVAVILAHKGSHRDAQKQKKTVNSVECQDVLHRSEQNSARPKEAHCQHTPFQLLHARSALRWRFTQELHARRIEWNHHSSVLD